MADSNPPTNNNQPVSMLPASNAEPVNAHVPASAGQDAQDDYHAIGPHWSLRWFHYEQPLRLFAIAVHGLRREGIGRLDEHTGQFTGGSEGPGFSEERAWFSSCDTWDPLGSLSAPAEIRKAAVADMISSVGVIVRYEVPGALATHTWSEYCRLARISHQEAARLEAAAREHGGDPGRWRVALKDVAVHQFLSIEAWYGAPGSPWERAGGPDGHGGVWYADKLMDLLFAYAQREEAENS